MELRAHPHTADHLVLVAERSPHMERIFAVSALTHAIAYDPALRGYAMHARTWAALRGCLSRPIDAPPLAVHRASVPVPEATHTVADRRRETPPPPPTPKRARCCVETQTDVYPSPKRSVSTKATQTEEASGPSDGERRARLAEKDEEESIDLFRVRTVVARPTTETVAVKAPDDSISEDPDVTEEMEGEEVETEGVGGPVALESQLLSRPMMLLPPNRRRYTPAPPPTPMAADEESMLSGYDHFTEVMRRRLLLRDVLAGV